MNNNITFFQDLRSQARNGAATGTEIGIGLCVYTLVFGIFFGTMESLKRSMGMEPSWPLFPGDCELEVFKNLESCAVNQEPMFKSFGDLMLYTVGLTTLIGFAWGASNVIASRLYGQRRAVVIR